LTLLVRRAGELITMEELRKAVWAADLYGDHEHRVGVAICKLREALSDSASSPRFIETLPRRGYRFIAPVSSAHQATGSKRMIAVLPFDDLGRHDDDHFADGLAEELITQLGRLNPQRLGVIARSSAVRYRAGEEPVVRAAADELGAHFVVLGSVRRDANRLRITARLVGAEDQSQLWSETYDRVAKDVITVQIEIAEQVARALAIELVPENRTPRPRRLASSVEAYEFYLQGRYHWNKRTTRSVLIAIEYFEKALAADPEYALAHTGLADCYVVLGIYGESTPAESFGKAKQYASRALELDADLAEAHSSLAYCLLQFDWDARLAEREHLRAIQLNANCAPAHHWYGLTLTLLGRFPEALSSLQRAQELDPFSTAIQSHVGRLSYFSRDFDRSLRELNRALEIDSDFVAGRYFLGMAQSQCGLHSKAIAGLKVLVAETKQHPIPVTGLAYAYGRAGKSGTARDTIALLESLRTQRRVPPYFMAMAWAGLGMADETLQCLEQAYAERSGWLFHLQMEAAFDAVRSDRRFADLTVRVHADGRAFGAVQ
jgi:TolB-like protein/tetratricopeptide (TPR) repeat protein